MIGKYRDHISDEEVPESIQALVSTALWEGRRSDCIRLHVGCACEDDKGTTYSGHNSIGCQGPKKCPHKGMAAGTDKPCYGEHAEINTLHQVPGDRRIVSMVVTHFPCANCSSTIAESGIKELYVLHSYGGDKALPSLLAAGVNVIILEGSKYNGTC